MQYLNLQARKKIKVLVNCLPQLHRNWKIQIYLWIKINLKLIN